MPRKPRQYSKSNVYHIIYKGVDAQDIFYDDNDRFTFLKYLLKNKREFKYKINAFCLMNNHIHLVNCVSDENLSNAMKSLSLKYVKYFNEKYNRIGPLFQSRFNSKCVENKKYFLDLCRYVHQNPEKAGICKTEKYKWSSFQEYIGKEKIIDKKILLHYYNENLEEFKSFTCKQKCENEFDFIEYELRAKIKDDELAEFLVNKLKLSNISELANLPEQEIKNAIEILKNMKYTSINQISRVTRINNYQIKKIWK